MRVRQGGQKGRPDIIGVKPEGKSFDIDTVGGERLEAAEAQPLKPITRVDEKMQQRLLMIAQQEDGAMVARESEEQVHDLPR